MTAPMSREEALDMLADRIAYGYCYSLGKPADAHLMLPHLRAALDALTRPEATGGNCPRCGSKRRDQMYDGCLSSIGQHMHEWHHCAPKPAPAAGEVRRWIAWQSGPDRPHVEVVNASDYDALVAERDEARDQLIAHSAQLTRVSAERAYLEADNAKLRAVREAAKALRHGTCSGSGCGSRCYKHQDADDALDAALRGCEDQA